MPDIDSTDFSILVLDDDADARNIVLATMTANGYRVREAKDGREGLERCREELPDLVISDVMMPNVSGIEFTKLLRTSYPDVYIPVLLLTAATEVEERVEGLDAGADDYLTKPFNFSELVARTSALIRIKALTTELVRRQGELERVNKELGKAQKQLIEKEREIVANQFAGTAAHNLGQPLTSLLLNARILRKSIKLEGNPQAAMAVQAIEGETRNLKELLEGMQQLDPNDVEDYVGDTSILRLKALGKKKLASLKTPKKKK
ncbi:UNVERIFIED_CONTAM: hypothetical protein GTU68_045090 [Idotea baltica]|nr:hypothetical protein [Idotea baltica]